MTITFLPHVKNAHMGYRALETSKRIYLLVLHVQNLRAFIYDQTERAKILLFLLLAPGENHSCKVYQPPFGFGRERTQVNDVFIAKGSTYCSKSKADAENKWNHPI